MVISTFVVNKRVNTTFGTVRIRVSNVTNHPSMASISTSYRPVVQVPLDTSVPHVTEIQPALPHLKFHNSAQDPQPPGARPKADIQFPHLHFNH